MANAPTEPRAPNAPTAAGAAFSETLLATNPARALTAAVEIQGNGDVQPARRSLSETLRALPVAIQGLWVGLVCIVLLVSSAAALRSLFTSNVGAAPPRPARSAPTIAVAPPAAPATTASSPTAAPATTPPPTISIGGNGAFGALAIRDRLASHVRLRKLGAFMDDLERLLAMDPTALDRADVRKLIADAAVYGMTTGPNGVLSPEGTRVFNFLTTSAGTAGPDILFDLVTTRGGSRAATYAEEALRRKDVRDKGTPALRIAYDLRVATACQERAALLDRVKADGDRRALAVLFQMGRCGPATSNCCLATDPAYKEAVRVINAKK